ncbi:MotA/TolQ/ExbB proton channel family protein [Blastopirellula sp. JC732]|uniref:MotA/TolQ/ExbB proton channel family protein n=1 Tax=Blastopirellula sediminis TaxID=2894196 RepID=A0A9X1SI88_9BACT|nr:MotA/TolQ/ExbB proton channel family protein [Blastopirellula sediminis]MCC9605397.1 MotA/TolQ/ExbB proton channel family protein [Blastopirellula sediminis]MCC9631303.1 MotA/TolQ/ExbB proton channel family protein [Blastopirellula sediminis]
MRRTIGARAILAYAFVLMAGVYGMTLLAQENPPAGETLSVEETVEAPVEEDSTPQRTLLDTLMDGGVVGALIGILSIVAVGFIVEHFLTIRKEVLMPEDIAVNLSELVEEGRVDEAIEVCQHPASRSLLAYVVEAGLARYRSSEFGFAEYKAAVEEAGEEQTGQLYRKIEVLGLIGQIAPMLGLTGTVLGMINAFNTIAATDGAPKPAELAEAIGQALVTTLLGLVVAIPAMVAYSFFGNRIDSLVSEAGKRVEQILTPLGRRR